MPDPQDPATFERSRLDWAEAGKEPHADLLAWYRTLLALRRSTAALTDPRLDLVRTRFDDDAGWLTVTRGPVTVACNLGRGTWTFPAGTRAELLAVSDDAVGRVAGGIELPPDTVAILISHAPQERAAQPSREDTPTR